MSNQSDCQEKIDNNFREVIGLLNKAQLDYWLCHGTLLGIIRDNSLIPWDHDVDIAMWAAPGVKDVIEKLMVLNGYSIKTDGGDYDFQCFIKAGGREIDFNYYRIDESSQMAYSEWYIPRTKFISFLAAISKGKEYKGKYHFFRLIFSSLSPFLLKLIELLKSNNRFYKSAGYTTPVLFLRQHKFVELEGVSMRVPVMSAETLEYVYGKDWISPKRNYNWTTDSPSTKINNSRFSDL